MDRIVEYFKISYDPTKLKEEIIDTHKELILTELIKGGSKNKSIKIYVTDLSKTTLFLSEQI